MTEFRFTKSIASFVLSTFIATQVLMLGSLILIPPKKAEACVFGITCNIQIGNTYDVAKDIGLAAVRQIAVNVANKFLTRLVSKLQDKYKIRNFLYYDQVLTDYYLNRYISDKITDPDLLGVYNLLERGFVSGAPTGTTGGPDPRNALIPRLNAAITKVYLDRGGVDPQKIRNPNNFATDKEYFDGLMAYFSNPPSFTEQSLQAEYGSFQSSATSAAQLEILVGNALKASRILGGTCRLPKTSGGVPIVNGVPAGLGGVDPQKSPAGCQQSGGTWQASALDQARSFIDNPTTFTANWMDAAIKRLVDNNFDPSNYKAAIGSLLGNFLFNQLLLDSPDGVLSDSPFVYEPEGAIPTEGTALDIDADGITDGYDTNSDGVADICVYGGTPEGAGPPCKGSLEALDDGDDPPPPPGGGLTCTDVPTAISCNVANHQDVVQRVRDYVVSAGIYQGGLCGGYEIVRRVAWALRGEGAGMLATFHSSQCNGFSADVLAYTDDSQVDILSSVDTGTVQNPSGAQWGPFPSQNEAGVHYVAPSDPGDPPGSY